MAAETLSVRDGGAWKPVVYPWVYDNGWKQIHKIHVRSGGAWKIAHKTNWDDYTLKNTYTWTSDQVYTVPVYVKYLEVTIYGHGGGGGARAGAAAHYGCSNWSTLDGVYHTHTAQGTAGGAGGYVHVIFEVAEDAEYSVEIPTKPPGGQAINMPMSYTGSYDPTVSSSWTADAGMGGTDAAIVFASNGDALGGTEIWVQANGGAGGNPGTLTVDSACQNLGGYNGYTLSGSNSGAAGNGSGTITAIVGTTEEQTITSGGGRAGGAPGGQSSDNNFPATDGSYPADAGYVELKEWGRVV